MSRYIDIEPYEGYVLQRYYRNSMGECVETVPLYGLPVADVQEVVKEWCDERNCIIVAREDFPRLEVRHGRWVDVEPAPHNLFYATCSVCGERQTIEVANFCPMCGASMDGDTE